MTRGERIHARRKQLGLTLEEVGRATGVAKSTVRKWESGLIESMRLDKANNLASILNTSIQYIMGDDEFPVTDYQNIEPMPDTYPVPIIGEIACGEPIMAEESVDGYAYLDNRIKADFALRCIGDSMINARIFDGDLVFIRKQSNVENGEIAAVIIDDVATLKRVYHYKNRIQLRPENPTFPVMDYEGEELNQIYIIGKAVAFLSGVK